MANNNENDIKSEDLTLVSNDQPANLDMAKMIPAKKPRKKAFTMRCDDY